MYVWTAEEGMIYYMKECVFQKIKFPISMKTKKLTFLNKLLKIQKQQKKIFFIKKKKEKKSWAFKRYSYQFTLQKCNFFVSKEFWWFLLAINWVRKYINLLNATNYKKKKFASCNCVINLLAISVRGYLKNTYRQCTSNYHLWCFLFY